MTTHRVHVRNTAYPWHAVAAVSAREDSYLKPDWSQPSSLPTFFEFLEDTDEIRFWMFLVGLGVGLVGFFETPLPDSLRVALGLGGLALMGLAGLGELIKVGGPRREYPTRLQRRWRIDLRLKDGTLHEFVCEEETLAKRVLRALEEGLAVR